MFTYLEQNIVYEDTTLLLVNSVANVISHLARAKTQPDNYNLAEAKNQLQKTIAEADRLSRERIAMTELASLEAMRRENQLYIIELEKRRCKYHFKRAILNLETPTGLQECNREIQAWLEQQKYEHNQEITKYVKEIQQEIARYVEEMQWRVNQHNMEFPKWKAQQDRELSLRLKKLDGEITIGKSEFDRETQMLVLQQQFENDRYPLWLSTRQFLTNAEIPALRVLVSPLVAGAFPLDKNEINSKLNILAEYYSDHQRPVKYFSDILKGINNTQQPTAEVLFTDFKCVPMLILDAKLGREKFYLSYAFWSSNAEYISNGQFVDGLSIKQQNYIYAKREVIRWQQLRAKKSERAKVDSLYGSKNLERLTYNLHILEAEKEAHKLGLDTDHFEYRLSEKQVKQTANYLVLLHCLNVGLWADIYFLLYAPTKEPLPPLLLECLHTLDILKDYSHEEITVLVAGLLDSYHKVYQLLANQGFAALVPELYLAGAQACYQLQVFDLQQQQINLSLETWLTQRSVTPMGDTLLLLEIMKPVIAPSDLRYLLRLQENLDQLGIRSYIDDILPFLKVLQDQEYNNHWEEEIPNQEGEWEEEIPNQKGEWEEEIPNQKGEWEEEILNQEGEVESQGEEEESNSLDLGNGLTLELVEIPGVRFKMGENHEIQLKGFFMGKYLVTQKQYQQVMGKNPSHFKGDNLPVEQITWHEAVKFCQKLSAKTGRKVKLPTEAQWEYAASAANTTADFLGDSDTPLSEYAWYAENSGSQTHPVGEKKPNSWGLYDLRGNVWEWCQDDWCDNIHNLPEDGSPFKYDNNTFSRRSGTMKQIRGGSWYNTSTYCGCSYRYRYDPGSRHYVIGFRVIVSTSVSASEVVFSAWHHRS